MRSIVKQRIGDIPDWEDCVQDVYCSSLSSLGRGGFQGNSSMKTWVYNIILRRITDFLRVKYRRNECSLLEADDVPSVIFSSERKYEIEEMKKKLENGFGSCLSPRGRQIFVLLLNGWEIFEIAWVYKISHKTVNSYVKYGRILLRRFFMEV